MTPLSPAARQWPAASVHATARSADVVPVFCDPGPAKPDAPTPWHSLTLRQVTAKMSGLPAGVDSGVQVVPKSADVSTVPAAPTAAHPPSAAQLTPKRFAVVCASTIDHDEPSDGLRKIVP